jgi:uncharacterized protein
MTSRNGQIRYVQVPAVDVAASAAFYEAVFGWAVRRRDDGATAFDDTAGTVSGQWVEGRPPTEAAGMLVCVQVDDVEDALAAVVQAGGRVVTPVTLQKEGEAYATVADPAGNVVGVFQEPTT